MASGHRFCPGSGAWIYGGPTTICMECGREVEVYVTTRLERGRRVAYQRVRAHWKPKSASAPREREGG